MERKSILKEREAYEAVVAFIHRCTELGITEEQTKEIHREVEGLIKAGIEIGRKENTTAEDSDVVQLLEKMCIKAVFWLRTHGNPHQKIIIDQTEIRLISDEVVIPLSSDTIL